MRLVACKNAKNMKYEVFRNTFGSTLYRGSINEGFELQYKVYHNISYKRLGLALKAKVLHSLVRTRKSRHH